MARTDDIAAGGECAPAIQPGRKITGLSAILLPFDTDDRVDWNGFENHVAWTAKAGLIPAVNMDTGYVALLDDSTRRQALDRMAAMNLPGGFVAGVCINDAPGASFDADAYRRRLEEVERGNGTPVIMQSYGLTAQDDDGIAASYQALAAACDRFIAFELGTMFAPFGRIYSLDLYAKLMRIPTCIGAKHSSLQRIPEWRRLALRDRVRPDFKVFTGNDLAIDMVMYGSDYLLGLSTFAPDLFGLRDRFWAANDPAFYELNDLLQYLGQFAFRSPTPAYKHSAAQFLALQGRITHDATHPESPCRPENDKTVLGEILDRCDEWRRLL